MRTTFITVLDDLSASHEQKVNREVVPSSHLEWLSYFERIETVNILRATRTALLHGIFDDDHLLTSVVAYIFDKLNDNPLANDGVRRYTQQAIIKLVQTKDSSYAVG
jgi:hypothetical protein